MKALLLVLCMAVAYATHESFNFILPAQKRECFFEDYKTDSKGRKIEAFVLSGGNLDILLTIHGPLSDDEVIKVRRSDHCGMLLLLLPREHLKILFLLRILTLQRKPTAKRRRSLRTLSHLRVVYTQSAWTIESLISCPNLYKLVFTVAFWFV